MPAKPGQFSDSLPDQSGSREPLGWKVRQSDLGDGPRSPEPQIGSGRCCVYNQTCERFLSAEVEAADFTQSGLETRLQSLPPTMNSALWLVPFRGIAPTSVRMPLDLVYLDRECVVIEAVESFPISRASTSSRPASSVLALPARSIASSGTKAGDQLIFRPPAEMKLMLEQLDRMKSETPQSRVAAQASSQPSNQSAGQATGHVLPWKDLSRPDPLPPAQVAETYPLQTIPQPAADQAPESTAQPAPEDPAPQKEEPWRKKRSWLKRFLSSEPDDKRIALRESIPGLSAFFFTGGAPVPHGIRNVSETGLFVLTEERWYPGTVIRITLTDQREPTAERSFTVNAIVMRWGNDGVGLHFVFQDKKDRRRGNMSAQERALGLADAASFKEYLAALRGELK